MHTHFGHVCIHYPARQRQVVYGNANERQRENTIQQRKKNNRFSFEQQAKQRKIEGYEQLDTC